MTTPGRLSLTIDTAASLGSAALFESDELNAALTWLSRQNQSRELLPAIEWLLSRAGRDKSEIGAIIVCLGPGSYAGLRVGLSTAKALAFGLGCQIVGVGRLQADAQPFIALTEGRVFALHAAGRAELAWAAYGRDGAAQAAELIAARLGSAEDFANQLESEDLVCADPEALPEALRDAIAGTGARLVAAPAARYEAVAQIGLQRLRLGDSDSLDDLVPLYLRAPAIGPQPPTAR